MYAGDMSVATACTLGFGRPQPTPEGPQRVGSLALADEDHRPGFEVQDDGQVSVAVADADLVDGDLLELAQVRPLEEDGRLAHHLGHVAVLVAEV
jgi:hypothetical protein